MNQTQGVLLFGLGFALFLGWLWKYPEEQVQDKNDVRQDVGTREGPALLKWVEDNGLEAIKGHLENLGVKKVVDVLGLDLRSLEPLLDARTAANLRKALVSLELIMWLGKKGVQDMGPLMLVGDQGESYKDLCLWTQLDVKEISRQLPKVEDKMYFKSAVEEKKPVLCPETGSGGWSYIRIFGVFGILGLVIIIVVIVIGLVVLYFGFLVVAVIIWIIIQAITGGRGRARARDLPPNLAVGFVSFVCAMVVSLVQKLWTNFIRVLNSGNVGMGGGRAARRRSQLASTADTPRAAEFSLNLYERFRGTYIDTDKCGLEWNHQDCTQVGGSTVLTVKMLCKNGTPYEFKPSDAMTCKVVATSAQSTSVPHVVEPTSLIGQNSFKVSFTTKVAGRYIISVKINNKFVNGGEIYRKYLPGAVDSNKTVFLDNTAVLVVSRGVYTAMKIIPKDSFGNKADIEEHLVDIEIRQDCVSGEIIRHEFVAYKNDSNSDYYELLLKLDKEGHYVGCVKYNGCRLGPPHFTILSLSEEDMKTVEKNISKKSLNVYYEATVLAEKTKKKVYCYISPRQLQVREYFLKVIPTRTFTCKVSPSTQITYHPDPKLFTLDDGFQEPITLMSVHRNILGATFHKFMLKNIGGSEKFRDKQTFFYNKLREHHKKTHRGEKRVVVSRFNLVETARHATKNFSTSDWCKKFTIEFQGEEGLDWGGLSREFFELMSVELFDVSNRLFMRFNEDDHQGLVHPNHSSSRPARWKLKHFLFAGKIVGKCLYESAMGNTQLIKAHFTRAFLAQLIGLRINYKYFETDDPSLYTSKVHYILENEVTDLGLVFAEEEFDSHGGPPVVIPLVENGEELDVTDMNKSRYLNVLSQYRFTRRVGDEIDHFLKGLNEIVPDNLLSIFDENELELLMCGLSTVSFEDLKEHSVVSGTSLGFQHVRSWFWSVTSSFTQEEMAKLLQFVTGSSQLPPGGFKELNPKFTITSAPTKGRLPTSHTCFNQICLPEYDSCEQFHTSLMTALNEGAEGFGML